MEFFGVFVLGGIVGATLAVFLLERWVWSKIEAPYAR